MTKPATMSSGERDLETRLLAAHEKGDLAALAGLYHTAASYADREGRGDAAAFFLTNAWVIALEAGEVSLSTELESELRKRRRLF